MNPKIEEFAKNDLIRSEYTESGCQECYYYQFDPDELQKFAELIIQECINVVHAKIDDSVRVAIAIETHFGID